VKAGNATEEDDARGENHEQRRDSGQETSNCRPAHRDRDNALLTEAFREDAARELRQPVGDPHAGKRDPDLRVRNVEILDDERNDRADE